MNNQYICNDARDIILEFTDLRTSARLSMKYYKKLYESLPKYYLQKYMIDRPDDGIARFWLIRELFESSKPMSFIDLCTTKEHMTYFIENILAHQGSPDFTMKDSTGELLKETIHEIYLVNPHKIHKCII